MHGYEMFGSLILTRVVSYQGQFENSQNEPSGTRCEVCCEQLMVMVSCPCARWAGAATYATAHAGARAKGGGQRRRGGANVTRGAYGEAPEP